MSEVVIRAASDEDLDDVMTLYAEFHAFHVDGVPDRLRPMPPQTPEEREALRAQICAILADSRSALFVAKIPGEVVGLAEVYLRQDDTNPLRHAYTYGYLQSLMVSASQRQTGIGRQLMMAAEAWARSLGASELRLEMWEFPAGPLRFYEAQGYTTLRRMMIRRFT